MSESAKTTPILWSVVVAVVAVASLGVWDQRREGDAALEEFAEQQAVVARVVGSALLARLHTIRRDGLLAAEADAQRRPAPRAVRESYADVRLRGVDITVAPVTSDFPAVCLSIPAPDARVVDITVARGDLVIDLDNGVEGPASVLLLRGPGETTFHALDGRVVEQPALLAALDAGKTALRIDRPAAASLGLPERMAVAGLTGIDAGALGRWGVAVVTSAAHERDRLQRAGYRLVFGVLVTGGLVAAFGVVALRRQRKELQLGRALAVADVQRRAEERLEAATRAATLGTFALGITHELSTPLAVIAGRADQLLPRVSGDERAATSVRAILDQTDRIGQVVRGFLGLARGRAPTSEHLEPIDMVDGAVGLVAHRFAKAGVTLAVTAEAGLPTVCGDARLLEHAVVNLLLNACDACDAGGHVDVHADKSAGFIVVTITDDGVGISPQDAEHVMEPFFTTKPGEAGTGLGLAIVKEIMKSHRGDLTLQAAAPRGTRAVISIPIGAFAAEDQTNEPATTTHEGEARGS